LSNLRNDLFGGLAAGVVALPLALAFGVAAGLGPAAGLYGAIAAGIIAAAFGGTPVQITGPTGPMTLVVAGIVAANVLPSGEVNLTVVVGVFALAGIVQILLGLLRAGSYIRYMPYPVISGFMSARSRSWPTSRGPTSWASRTRFENSSSSSTSTARSSSASPASSSACPTRRPTASCSCCAWTASLTWISPASTRCRTR